MSTSNRGWNAKENGEGSCNRNDDLTVRTATGERKFIGGAEKARRVARQKGIGGSGNRIMRPDEKQRLSQRIPVRLNPFERFFAGLLRSATQDFCSSKENDNNDMLWRTICQRLGLPVPDGPLPAVYPDGKQHFYYRAALVVEEARHAVAEGVAKLDRKYKHQKSGNTNNSRQQHQRHRHDHDTGTLRAKLQSSEQNERTGHTVLVFVSETSFTPKQIDVLRPGTIFALTPLSPGRHPSISFSSLASILPSSRDDMINERKLGVMIFSGHAPKNISQWELTPLTNLITQQRMYEACTSKDTTKVPFLHPLLGGRASTHTRFDEGPDGETTEILRENGECHNLQEDDIVPGSVIQKVFNVPTLNTTQEKAARSYLGAEANTITLVQGPPGTGTLDRLY